MLVSRLSSVDTTNTLRVTKRKLISDFSAIRDFEIKRLNKKDLSNDFVIN